MYGIAILLQIAPAQQAGCRPGARALRAFRVGKFREKPEEEADAAEAGRVFQRRFDFEHAPAVLLEKRRTFRRRELERRLRGLELVAYLLLQHPKESGRDDVDDPTLKG